jgi:tRNA nucleotidyltransferase (CCA-adding enzyme)
MHAEEVRRVSDEKPYAMPQPVRDLLRTAGQVAERTGVAAYAVGGFVRDLLLDRPNLDIDIVAEGDGIAYAGALAHALGADFAAVTRFGTAHLRLPLQSPELPARMDVATARRETYVSSGALPAVEQAGLNEDLYRRDFTINAMAIRLTPQGPGALIDPFGGQSDLGAGQIRILHPRSFCDDPTRILRAVRFAQRHDFQLEPGTWEAARSAVEQGCLDTVSMERLSRELLLILQEPQSGGALATLAELGVLARLLPGVTLSSAEKAQLDRVDQLGGEVPDLAQAAAAPWLTKLLLLLHTLPPSQGSALIARLKLNREQSQTLRQSLTVWITALAILKSPDAKPSQVARTLAGWRPEGLLLLYMLGAGESVTRYWQDWRHVGLAITGADLIRAGVPAGPAIGRALALVLADRLDGAAPDRASQLSLALRYAYEEA